MRATRLHALSFGLVEEKADSRRLTLSVIVPVYNEVNTIATVLESVRDIPLKKEIIVVNDGSTDGTFEFLEDEWDRDMTTVLNSPFNLGKGAAVRLGLEYVRGEIVIIQDSDLELDPADIPRLIRPIQKGRADVVYGSRFMRRGRWGGVAGQAFAVRLANAVLTLATNLLFGSRLTDMETCYKACRASVIRAIRLECVGFEFEPELTAKLLRLGYCIHEMPVSYRPRTRREGKKIRWTDGVKALYYLLKYRFQDEKSFAMEPEPQTGLPEPILLTK